VLAQLIRNIAIVVQGRDVFPVRVQVPGMTAVDLGLRG
jgi:hypothetical protein